MRRQRMFARPVVWSVCLLLSACRVTGVSSSATTPEDSREESGKIQWEQSTYPTLDLNAYLVLGTEEAPYTHRLVRVPAQCILASAACPSPTIMQAYPGEGVTPSHLHWAPDGSLALFLDTYEPRVLQLEVENDRMRLLASDVPTINDELVWLADGRPVFVIQGPTDYTTDLVALDVASEGSQIVRLVRFDGLARLLGRIDSGPLLASIDEYGLPKGIESGKEVVVDVRLVAADPVSGSVAEYRPDIDWLSQFPQALLPDGRHLVVGTTQTELWDLTTGQKIGLGHSVIWPTGSPDGESLAFISRISDEGPYILILLDIATQETKQYSELPVSSKPFWSPDSRFVVLGQLELESSVELGSLHVIDVESGIVTTPSIDFGGLTQVLDISWGP